MRAPGPIDSVTPLPHIAWHDRKPDPTSPRSGRLRATAVTLGQTPTVRDRAPSAVFLCLKPTKHLAFASHRGPR
jgi:hypothetical protein